MKLTYNIREAQAHLSKLCRANEKFVIANRDKAVMVALPIEEYEAMLETMDVLSDPKAMAAIREDQTSEMTFREIDLEDEDFGL